MSKKTRDQYTNLLQSRMDEYIANNPPADNVQKWASQPLLEWFVRAAAHLPAGAGWTRIRIGI